MVSFFADGSAAPGYRAAPTPPSPDLNHAGGGPEVGMFEKTSHLSLVRNNIPPVETPYPIESPPGWKAHIDALYELLTPWFGDQNRSLLPDNRNAIRALACEATKYPAELNLQGMLLTITYELIDRGELEFLRTINEILTPRPRAVTAEAIVFVVS